MKNPKTTSNTTKLLYGIGAFGYGSIGQTMSSFLMFFGTSILGIPGFLMGIAVGVSTVWDAVTDPIVGHLSDNTCSRVFGKRHGYILFSSFVVAFFNILIWSISPTLPIFTKFIFLLILLLIIETFNTLYSTPYGALGLDLAKTYDERTAIQNYKTVFSFLSLLVPSLLMTAFLSPSRYVTMSASNKGYQDIAIITSVLCIVCGIVCFFGTYKEGRKKCMVGEKNKKQKLNTVFADFFGLIKQPNVGRLIVGYAVSLSAGAFITSLGLHVFTYTFQFTTLEIPVIMVCLIAGIIIAQPLWFTISKKRDKVTALIYALGIVLTGIMVFAAVLLFRNSIYAYQVLPIVCITIFLCGLGTGCLYCIPISMFADCVDKNNQEGNQDKTAISIGFLTFCTKISNAVIMFIIGLSLDLIGFRGGSAVQTLSTQNWLGWLMVAGVSAASIFAMVIYSKYSYSKNDFIKILEARDQRFGTRA